MSLSRRQRGIATIVSLIALLIMMIAAVALIHSISVGQLSAGNFAFRRDLTNRAELAVQTVNTQFSTGALSVPSARWSTAAANNYSAVELATDSKSGIPSILLSSDATFQATWTAPDVYDATNQTHIRYIVDRMCSSTVSGLAPSKTYCSIGKLNQDTSGTQGEQKAGGSFIPVYRVSIRIIGPKNAMTFLQTTFQE